MIVSPPAAIPPPKPSSGPGRPPGRHSVGLPRPAGGSGHTAAQPSTRPAAGRVRTARRPAADRTGPLAAWRVRAPAVHPPGTVRFPLAGDNGSVQSLYRGHRFPLGEGLLSKQAIVDRLETVACHSEQILNRTANAEKALDLRLGLESPHLALPRPRVLVGNCGPVAVVLPASMGSRQAELATGGRVASQLVGDQLGMRSWPN